MKSSNDICQFGWNQEPDTAGPGTGAGEGAGEGTGAGEGAGEGAGLGGELGPESSPHLASVVMTSQGMRRGLQQSRCFTQVRYKAV